MSHSWYPEHSIVGRIKQEARFHGDGWTDLEIETEPQFYGASLDFVKEHGGPITLEYLDNLPSYITEGVFDSRVHMLMPGMLPCIGGWHLDNINRNNNNEPEITSPLSSQYHYLCLVGECSTTQFLNESFTWDDPSLSYEQASLEIRRQELDTVSLKTGQIVRFTDADWHRGRPAKYRGWRWLGRLTVNSDRPIVNKIRTQTQVYLQNLEGGW